MRHKIYFLVIHLQWALLFLYSTSLIGQVKDSEKTLEKITRSPFEIAFTEFVKFTTKNKTKFTDVDKPVLRDMLESLRNKSYFHLKEKTLEKYSEDFAAHQQKYEQIITEEITYYMAVFQELQLADGNFGTIRTAISEKFRTVIPGITRTAIPEFIRTLLG